MPTAILGKLLTLGLAAQAEERSANVRIPSRRGHRPSVGGETLGGIAKSILAAVVVSIAAADARPGDDPSRGATSGPRARLEAVKTGYMDARGRFQREYKAAKAGEIESLLARYLAEIDRAAAEGMRLARDHAGEPVAFSSTAMG